MIQTVYYYMDADILGALPIWLNCLLGGDSNFYQITIW